MNESPWYVWRTMAPARGATVSEGGAPDLMTAFAEVRVYMRADLTRRAVIFNGQPSDGARVVVRIDLDGDA